MLLVDDVATTGATLTAAAGALRAAGALEVVALTVARTPPAARARPGLASVRYAPANR
jgi:orotate phosphoribosyltransferase